MARWLEVLDELRGQAEDAIVGYIPVNGLVSEIQRIEAGRETLSVLRTQADDLRSRRRDRALSKAQSLPVKLVFPLVICFLPGVFVVTLGPAFKEFFDLAQGIVSGTG